MHSLILSVLGLDSPDFCFNDKANLYHKGDLKPFANLFMKNGCATLRVNSGEIETHASSIDLGRYSKP